MFKNLLFFLFFFAGIRSFAQLSADIALIQQQNDLMGGVVTVYCSNQIVHHIPFGTADYTRGIPVTDSTLFRIASVSKTITAIAFLSLVDEGLVQLDENISSILGYPVKNPYFPNISITPRMLLSHKSSIIDGNTYSAFLTATYSQNPMPNLNELLTLGGAYYSMSNFNNTSPGSYFSYSNLNFVILGTLIEKISGQRFDEYCRNTILIPMAISGSFNVNHINNIDNVAVLYRRQSGIWTAQADDYQGVQPVYTNLSGYIPGTNGARFAPQGGLRCSGSDLSKIFMMLLNYGEHNGTTILSKTSVMMMFNKEWNYFGTNGNNYYGLFNSWGLGIHRILNIANADVVLESSQSMFGHPGEAYGLVSDAYVDTTRKLGLVFITNGCGVGYQTNNQSAFYTVEKEIFDAINPYADILDCFWLSTQQNKKNDLLLEVLPNPFATKIKISTTIDMIGKKYIIYDPTGRVYATGIITSENDALNLSFLPDGVYIFHIQNETTHINKTILKY
jgi:CubicO group peptidase (beta-lactamase class C family)